MNDEQIYTSCDVCNLSRPLKMTCDACESITCVECHEKLLRDFDYAVSMTGYKWCFICKEFYKK